VRPNHWKGDNMRKAAFASILVMAMNRASAGTPYLLQDGLSRAPAVVLHCKTAGNIVVPCGTAATPLVVTGGTGGGSSGSATATNQQAQITAEQSSASALGTPADPSYTGGVGSVTSVLKSVWSILGEGVSAVPVGGVPVSRSLNLPSQQSTQVFPINSGRHYLAFQVPQGSYVWVNLLGGPATPNGADCAYFAPGTFYESGQYVNRGAVTFYSPIAAVLSAWEG
jgi:hypothetical protein